MSGRTIRGWLAACVVLAPTLACAQSAAQSVAAQTDPIGDLLRPTPSAAEAYDNRLRASAAAAEGFQGPLNGGWTLSIDGHPRYDLQIVDRSGALEGAWRDLSRPGALDASGFVDDLVRAGGDLTLRFGGVTAVLHPAGARWTGELTAGGRTELVVLARRP